MTRIVIEVFARPTADGAWAGDSGYVAVATRDGQLVANGGPGSGGTERAAIQEAVNSLFKRGDEREAARPAPLLGVMAEDYGLSDDIFTRQEDETNSNNLDPLPPAAGGEFGEGTYTAYLAILHALGYYLESRAAGDRPTVKIDYRDSHDRLTINREIIPTSLDTSQTAGRPFVSHSAKLTAIDVAKDEPRHFIVDRIEKLVIG